mmetsp:Transcript_39204/g.124853  ORF Transcript_39204/g.124853 Transcript_39204/m.124853 type:complete len:351 (-) Transcript_39204:1561-2613(-)
MRGGRASRAGSLRRPGLRGHSSRRAHPAGRGGRAGRLPCGEQSPLGCLAGSEVREGDELCVQEPRRLHHCDRLAGEHAPLNSHAGRALGPRDAWQQHHVGKRQAPARLGGLEGLAEGSGLSLAEVEGAVGDHDISDARGDVGMVGIYGCAQDLGYDTAADQKPCQREGQEGRLRPMRPGPDAGFGCVRVEDPHRSKRRPRTLRQRFALSRPSRGCRPPQWRAPPVPRFLRRCTGRRPPRSPGPTRSHRSRGALLPVRETDSQRGRTTPTPKLGGRWQARGRSRARGPCPGHAVPRRSRGRVRPKPRHPPAPCPFRRGPQNGRAQARRAPPGRAWPGESSFWGDGGDENGG